MSDGDRIWREGDPEWTWQEEEVVPRFMWSQIPVPCVVTELNSVATLKARVQELETAARALLIDIDTLRPDFRPESTRGTEEALAKLLRPIVYQEGEIPVDRAGRPMYDKYGVKLDIEDRERK
jgi:hypothetical protein